MGEVFLGRAGSRTYPQPRGSREGQQVHPNTSPVPDRAREEPGPDGTTSVTSFLVGSDPVCATPRQPTFGSCRKKSTWICPCWDSRCLPGLGQLRVRPRRGFGVSGAPRGAAEATGLESNRLQVNPGVCRAWTHSRFPSQNILFASGQSITVFRNKKYIPKGKLVSS